MHRELAALHIRSHWHGPSISTLVLHDVRHVPELTWSLISVGQLDEVGFRASFSFGGWTLHKGNLLLTHAPKTHSLYPLYVTLRQGDLFLVDIPVSSLWYGRLGHLSKVGITHLSKAGYIPKLSFSDHQFCEHCQYNEQVVVPQSTSTKRIEPLRFGLFGCLWTHATSVSRWHVILRHLHR